MKSLNARIVLFFFAAMLTTVSIPSAAATLQTTGRITLLRIHDVGTGWGPGNDFLDAEVIIRLDTRPGEAFGFQLRDDANRPVRQAMHDLLRDAFNNNIPVTINYEKLSGKVNSVLFRVWLTQ